MLFPDNELLLNQGHLLNIRNDRVSTQHAGCCKMVPMIFVIDFSLREYDRLHPTCPVCCSVPCVVYSESNAADVPLK